MTEEQIDKIAQALYALEGWKDRQWDKIDPSGRERWRGMVRLVLKMAEETLEEKNRELRDEIERLRAEIYKWHDCALYDPLMEGPRFKGWNRSSLDRCRKQFIEAANQQIAVEK